MASPPKHTAKVRKLRSQALDLLADQKFEKALNCFCRLIELEPGEGEWLRRASDCHWRLKNDQDRLEYAFRAAEAYAESGLILKGIAMCKVVLSLEPKHQATSALMESLFERKPLQRVGRQPNARQNARAPKQPGSPSPTKLSGRKKPPASSSVDPLRARKARARLAAAAALREIRARRAAMEADLLEPIGPGSSSDPAPPPSTSEPLRQDLVTQSEIATPIAFASTIRAEPQASLGSAPALESMPLSQRILAVKNPSSTPPLRAVYSLTLDQIPQADLRSPRVPRLNEETTAAPQDSAVLPEMAEPAALMSHNEPANNWGQCPAEAALVQTPLLNRLSRDVLHDLLERLDLVELLPHQTLFREGAQADAMYVVVEGEVIVSKELPQNRHLELARLDEGEFFGEIGLLSDQPRQASVSASQYCRLLCLDRRIVSDLIEQHPTFLSLLLQFLRERLVESLMLTSPLFAPFGEAHRRQLIEQFEFLEVEADCALVEKGQIPIGFYILLAGQAFLHNRNHIVRLGPGDTFGGNSLVAGCTSEISVRTVTKSYALCLPADTFREVILTHPTVLEYVSNQAPAEGEEPGSFEEHVTFF